jgi:flavodoxin
MITMRKNWKKLVGIVLAAGLLAGCGTASGAAGQSSNSSSASKSASGSSDTAGASVEVSSGSAAAGSGVAGSSAETTTGGKTLVVYYSASGNTEAVANTIAHAVGADLFEITPAEPYTDDDLDWTDDNSRVSREHEDEDLQNQVELTTTDVEGWDSYDTVFIGYPIWWGIAAWPVNQFVQNNDFSGKTVIPFCTSSSSGIGQSGELLEQMAGTGDWQEGQRFSSRPDDADVTEWAKSVL